MTGVLIEDHPTKHMVCDGMTSDFFLKRDGTIEMWYKGAANRNVGVNPVSD